MSNGKLIFAGGVRGTALGHAPHPPELDVYGLDYTYIFDPTDELNPWKVAGVETGIPHAMAEKRFYPTLTQLGIVPTGTISGNIVVMSGWKADGILALEPQYYDETDGWHNFPYSGATQQFQGTYDFYPSSHLIPCGTRAGQIFYSVPMVQAWVFNPFWSPTTIGSYWTQIGQERTNRYRLNGTSTMLPLLPPYDSARVIIMGGSSTGPPWGGTAAVNTVEIIDIGSENPVWSQLDNLYFARKNHLCVTLPNDMLFVVGGNLKGFDIDPVFTPELIDTTTNLQSTMLPAHIYPRGHHLAGALLPDASVWVSGQGGVSQPDEYNIEIYKPGYFFEGTRPFINSAPDEITYGSQFNIETSHEIEAIRLIRLGVVTHSTDMSQLSVGLSYDGGPSNYTVYTTLLNPNVAPPGLYMLFVLRPKLASISQQTMIPSEAKIVKLI